MISLIVPAYNCEAYIKECLDSILAQDNTDIEIIVIDDGSTDGTRKIVDDYCIKFRNVYCVEQENSGLSAARNLGLEHAKGDWIAFVDGDDTLPDGALSTLQKPTNITGIGSVVSTISVSYDSTRVPRVDENWYRIKWTGLKDIAPTELFNFHCSASGKLFKKSVIDQYKLRFPTGFWYEDWYWHFCFYLVAPKAYFTPKATYNYLRHENTFTSNVSSGTDNRIIQHLVSTSKIIEFSKKNNLEQNLKPIVLRLLRESFLFIVKQSSLTNKYHAMYKCLEIINTYQIDVKDDVVLSQIASGDILQYLSPNFSPDSRQKKIKKNIFKRTLKKIAKLRLFH